MISRPNPSEFSSFGPADTAEQLWDELLGPATDHPLAQWLHECETDGDLNDAESIRDDSLAAPTAAEVETLLNQLKRVDQRKPVDAQAIPVPQSLQSDRAFTRLSPELQAAFVDDVTRCTARLQTALLHMQTDAAHRPSWDQVHRELHTLKGTSATVGLEDWAASLHRFEDQLQDTSNRPDQPPIGDLQAWVEQVQSHIKTFQQSTAFTCRTDRATNRPAAPLGHHHWQANLSVDSDDDLLMLEKSEHVQLPVAQLDQMIAAIEDLTASQARSRTGHRSLCKLHQQLSALRAQPAQQLIQRLQQAAQWVAQCEGKDVQVQIIGEDVAINRSLQQRLFEPLMHIVRNAVCHGIESPAQRLTVGKAASGLIRIQFAYRSGLLIINITDDGKGLDHEAIRRRGIKLGLLSKDAATSPETLHSLIFEPHFSTKFQVTVAAGRGMGLHAALTAIEELGGWLKVESQPGQGLAIQLAIPHGRHIEPVVLLQCVEQVFAVPATDVETIAKTDAKLAELDLAAWLRQSDTPSSSTDQPVQLICRVATTNLGPTSSRRIALLVDRVIGSASAELQPFPPLLKHHPYCTGIALCDHREAALMINLQNLVELQAKLTSHPIQHA